MSANTAYLPRALPRTIEDLPPGFKPQAVIDCDANMQMLVAPGLKAVRRRRVRIVAIVHPDQNRIIHIVKDMGPATGEDELLIPCEGEVEMAHIHELVDAALERRKKRAAVRALYLPERQKAYRDAVLDLAEHLTLAKEGGKSQFGPYHMVERTSG